MRNAGSSAPGVGGVAGPLLSSEETLSSPGMLERPGDELEEGDSKFTRTGY